MNMLSISAVSSNLNEPEDNLQKEDKSSAPKLSFIRRFHCIVRMVDLYHTMSIGKRKVSLALVPTMEGEALFAMGPDDVI